MPVILKSNRGDHEILRHFLVTNTKGPAGEVDVLAMDFLVDYQCEIHLEKELEVTIMDRKPAKPQEGGKEEPYASPSLLFLPFTAGKDKASRSRFVVDTGSEVT